MCLTLSEPDFYLNKKRHKNVCQFAGQVYKESKKNNIDPILLMAVIYRESGWKKTVVSPAGACGLTQVIPKYTGKYSPVKKKYSCKQLKNPKISISAGARILKWWIKYHKGDVRRGLCGYSSGFRCKGKRPLKAGMRYADRVLKTKRKITARANRIKDKNF